MQPSQRPIPAVPASHRALWGSSVRDGTVRFVRALGERNIMEAAGAVAFRFFLSTVPLLVFVGFVLGRMARARGVDDLLDPLSEVAPAVTDDLLRSELTRLAGAHGPVLAPLSVLGFFWMTSSGAHTLLNVFAMVFTAPRRPWWRQRLIALGWTVVVLAIVVGGTWARVTFDLALHPEAPHPFAAIVQPAAVERAQARAGIAPAALSERRRRRHPHVQIRRSPAAVHSVMATVRPPLRDPAIPLPPEALPPAVPLEVPPLPLPTPSAAVASDAVPLPGPVPVPDPPRRPHAVRMPWESVLDFAVLLLAGTCVLAAFYRYALVYPRGALRRVWPGALAATAAWLLVSWGFGAYVRSLDRYTVYYGSLAAVAVLQIWLFLTSLVLLLGGQINAQLESPHGTLSSPPTPGHP